MDMNMSCLSITVEDLLRCSFGLSRLEVRVITKLLESPDWVAVAPLARSMRKDRSVIQRGLSTLLEKGLIERDQRNKAGGGFEYLYRTKDKRMLKRSILDKSQAFSMMVKETVQGW